MKIIYGNIDVSKYIISYRKKGNFIDGNILGQVPIYEIEIEVSNKDKLFDDMSKEFFVYEDNNNQTGIFNIYEKPEKYTSIIKFVLYDNMIKLNKFYETSLDFSKGVLVRDVLEDIATKSGLTIIYDNLPGHILNKSITWYDNTLPMIDYVGWIAEIAGTNASANNLGEIVFNSISSTYEFELERVGDLEVEDSFIISNVCFDNGEVQFTSGTSENDTLFLNANNPFIDDQSIVDYLCEKYSGYSFTNISTIKFKGNRNIRLGSVIKYLDYQFIVTSLIADEFGGESYPIYTVEGIACDLDTSEKYKYVEPSIKYKAIEADLGRFKELTTLNLNAMNASISGKLEASVFDAYKATIDEAYMTKAEIESAYITEANIKSYIADQGYVTRLQVDTLLADKVTTSQLDAATARITTLESTTVKANELQAKVGEFGYLKASEAELTYATIINLNSANANIASISGDLATYKKTVTEEFEARDATIDELIAKDTEIGNALIKKASVDELSAVTARVETLETDTLKTSELSAEVAKLGYATISSLNATNANISNLQSELAQIDEAKIEMADVETLLAEKAFLNEAQVNTLVAKKGYLTEAQVDTLVVGKGYATSLEVNELLANKVTTDELEAAEARISSLETNTLKTKDLSAEVAKLGYATVTELNASNAKINTLTAKDVEISNKLTVAEGNIKNLQTDKLNASEFTAYQATVTELLADKATVKELESTNAAIESLQANDASIQALVAKKANITDLNSTNAEIDSLKAKDAEIDTLLAKKIDASTVESTYLKSSVFETEKASINELISEKATIDDLDSSNARISTLETTTLKSVELSAEVAKLGYATVTELNAAKGRIDTLEADTVKTDELESTVATFGYLKTSTASATYATITNLNSANANINSLTTKVSNIEKAYVNEATVNELIVAKGYLTEAEIDTLVVNKGYLTEAKVNTLITNKGYLNEANVKSLIVNEGYIKEAEIEELVTGKGYLTEAEVETLVVDKGYLNTAQVNTLITNKGYITNAQAETLIADKGYITTAETTNLLAGYATIDLANVKAGSITTAMIGTGVVGTAQIADGSITDAKIVGLTASKITAGTLDAGTIDVINLNAANITVGTINGQQIANGAIDTNKLSSSVNSSITNANTNASQALTDAANAQDTANSALSAAGDAQTTADGKNTVFYQSSAPSTTGRKINDVWFDTDDGNKMYYWSGTAWTAKQFGTNAIANASITNALIADATIQSAKIANLDAAKITTGTLSADRIASGSISSAKIASNAITSDKIATNAIIAEHISTGVITGDKLVASTITGDKIASKTITASNIAANTITAAQIATGTITATQIASGTITATQIKSGAITSALLAADSVTAEKINVSSLSAISADLGTVTAGSINIGNGNFVVTSAGNLTAKNGEFEGKITTTSGKIGFLNINNYGLYANLSGGQYSDYAIQKDYFKMSVFHDNSDFTDYAAQLYMDTNAGLGRIVFSSESDISLRVDESVYITKRTEYASSPYIYINYTGKGSTHFFNMYNAGMYIAGDTTFGGKVSVDKLTSYQDIESYNGSIYVYSGDIYVDGYSYKNHTHNYAGSSSVGGSATSAVKLDSSAGSATQPVYFANGVPVATTYTLGKSVPSDAKFTDTTYTSLKNPYALTIQGNGTTLTNGTYDGSAAKTINITPGAIGAAASSHTHDDRLFVTLVPTGTAIPANANLNTTTYLKVGRYYCSQNTTVATFTNCPTVTTKSDGTKTGVAFMMEVYSPLSTTLDNETTGTWVYRLRKLTTYTGLEYIQSCYAGGTAGTWTYGAWVKTTSATDLSSYALASHTHSGYASSSHTHSYLPLSGGIITGGTGDTPLYLESAHATASYLGFKNTSTTIGFLGFSSKDVPAAYVGGSAKTLLHAGNYNSYAAPKQNGIYYIEGTGSTAGTWLGSHDEITAYYEGLVVAYKIPVAGASTTTLNINSLGAVNVVRNVTTAVSTAYAVQAVLVLIYTVDTSGTAYWKVADYDSNTYLRVYRQTTGYNADYPLLVSRTAAASIATAGTNGSNEGVYAVMWDDTSLVPTLNPSTGLIKAAGLTITKNDITIATGTTQSATKGIKWSAINSKNPYIGYALDQTDGTFVWSITGTNYASGLAIGGGSGNLLWKGARVATATDLAGYATTGHTHSEYASSSHTHSGYASSSHTHSYLPLSGGTVTGSTTFPAIELSGATPYIDFHFGSSTADNTSRIIESSSGVLNINGTVFTKTDSGSRLTAAALYKTSTTYPVYGCRVLYSNSTGTTGNVTLAESAANFTYIIIIAGFSDTGASGSLVVYSPNGKTVDVGTMVATSNGGSFGRVRYSISGTTMSVVSGSNYIAKVSSGSWSYTANGVYCKAVLGFK